MRLGTRRQLTAGIATLGLALGSLAILPPLPASAAPPVTLTFLNFNDFHGRIDDPASPPAAATADGTSKWASTISRLRAAAETANGAGTVALMSAGDNWGASLFNSFIANDQPTIDVLNEMDVAAASTGNHEFDRGWPYLRDNVLNNPDPAKRPEFPLLGANVYDAGTGVPVMQEYVVLNLSGVRVGVIGAVTQDVPSLVSPAGIQGLSFGDPVDAVNRVAAQLSDGNNGNGEADVIVAEYHEGAPLPQSAATLDQQVAAGGPFAKIVLQTSPAVDVIFNGHSHQPYAYLAPVPGEPGNTRPVVQTGNYGDRIGQVTIAVDASADAVPGSATATLVVQDDSANDALPHVAQVRAIVAAAAAFASIVGAQPVGAVTADVTTAFSGGGYTGPGGTYVGPTRDDRSKESALGGLVANALRDTLSDPLMGGAQIGVVNPGGLRAELFSAPDGVVTFGEANAVLPFANNLWTTTLTGAQFKALLEQQWQRNPQGQVPSTPYLQLGLSDNVTYTFDPSLPEGSRITSIAVGGAPIDPSAPYRIGTFSFLATGGDNFRVLTQGTNTKDSGLVDRDGWIDYLGDSAPVTPDFARQSVQVSPTPTIARLGLRTQFTLSNLDLTSLGAPANTSVNVALGGTSIGTVPAAGGVANVDLTVPFGTPLGATLLTATASPSGTTVTIPVTVVDPAFVATPTPTRLVDTRDGFGLPKVALAAGVEVRLDVRGKYGIAADAAAVAINITSVNAGSAGWIRAYGCGSAPTGDTSNLNPEVDRIVANLAVVPLDATGAVCFVSYAGTDLVVDLQGWYPAATDFVPVPLKRLADTRFGTGIANTLSPNTVTELQVAGVNGVAADASAVVLNLTAVADEDGFVTAYPCGTPTPTASNVNAWPGHAIANASYTAVGTGGKVCVLSNISTDLVVDLQGWYPSSSAYHAFSPVRALDTRIDETPLTKGNVRIVPIAGLYGVPSSATAVSVNVTAVNAQGPAFVKVFPCGRPVPVASNGNTSPDRIVASQAVVPVGVLGTICIVANWTTDIIVDVQGWQSTAPQPV